MIIEIIIKVLAVISPIVGVIIYVVHKNKKDGAAAANQQRTIELMEKWKKTDDIIVCHIFCTGIKEYPFVE
jgi:hypothetical protein